MIVALAGSLLSLGAEVSAILNTPKATIYGEFAGEFGKESAGYMKWHRMTFAFKGVQSSEGATPNPFLDYRLDVTFTHPNSGSISSKRERMLLGIFSLTRISAGISRMTERRIS